MIKRRQNLYFLFQFTLPWVLLTLAFTTIAHLRGFSEGNKNGIIQLIVPLILVNLIGFGLWGALFLPIFLIARKLNLESNHYFRNFLIHLAHGALFLIFQLAVYAIASGSVAPEFWARYPELLPYIKGMSMGGLSLSVTFYAVIIFAIQTYLSRLRDAEDEKRTAELRSELVQAQLQALKMQIQPHFLFNTLNSISSLVLTNPLQAHQMIAQLGDFLRLTLDYSQDQMVTLSEELRFLRSYLEIEQIRFSDRLKINFEVEPEVLGAMVPPLLSQPIVENSIKHAVSHRRSGGLIEIKADKFEGKLRLQINDNGTDGEEKSMNLKKKEKAESSGTGVANVQNRLKHFFNNQAGFEILNQGKEGTRVILLIPLSFENGQLNGKIDNGQLTKCLLKLSIVNCPFSIEEMETENKIKVLIVDDEPLARALIVELLKKFPEFQIVGECSDGKSAINFLKKKSPDLIFLDVQMPGIDGLTFLEELNETPLPSIIFVTAYDNYAIRAFDFHAVDYLLKPFSQSRFEKALFRAKERILQELPGEDMTRRQISSLLENYQNQAAPLKRLFLKDRGKIVLVNPETINWIEADDKYIRLHTSEKKYLIRQTLNAVEAELDPHLFARVHRSYIVNLTRILELHPMFNGEYVLILSDGTRLTLSRNYRDRFFDKFGKH